MDRAGRGAADRRHPLALPLGLSAALHLVLAASIVFGRGTRARPLPPVYKVDLVAAPPGPRAVGVVNPAPPAPAQPVAEQPPPRAQTAPKVAPVPAKAPLTRTPPKAATPVPVPAKAPPKNAAAPAAGGGPTGGRGADVATIRTEGIEFPYPGYLSNIVRQIALRFNPENPSAPLRAEVFFLIHRDGGISDFRFLTRSGVYAFDLEAQGAVEAAASAHAFGGLPSGFTDDVLPVIFSFDPRILR